jgi:hypothetical protein
MGNYQTTLLGLIEVGLLSNNPDGMLWSWFCLKHLQN